MAAERYASPPAASAEENAMSVALQIFSIYNLLCLVPIHLPFELQFHVMLLLPVIMLVVCLWFSSLLMFHVFYCRFLDILHEAPLFAHRKAARVVGSVFYCVLLASWNLFIVPINGLLPDLANIDDSDWIEKLFMLCFMFCLLRLLSELGSFFLPF